MLQKEVFDVLLVEDNPADVYLIRQALRRSTTSCKLHTVEDGRTALDVLLNEHSKMPLPDLIILDLNLPLVSGHEVLKRVKNHEHTKSVPVVIMSSSNAELDVRRAYESHANCYIKKAENLEDLFRIVESLQLFWFHQVTLPPRTFPAAEGELLNHAAF